MDHDHSKAKTVTVRDLIQTDYPVWLEMWKDYCAPWIPPDRVTNVLWNRLMHDSTVGLPEGIVAVNASGDVIGFCHYVRHAHTWGTGWWCHCEDLFVIPEARDAKVGKALLQFLLARGQQDDWDSIYGHTDKSNPAQFLYGRFTPVDDKLTFTLDLKECG